MGLKGLVDKCYYINLEHRTDKKEALISHLNNLNILDSFTRSEGVRPEDLGYVRSGDKFEILEYSIAAAKSHQNVIRDAKYNNYECILVLEDDALFHIDSESNGLEVAKKAIEQIRQIDDWQLLYLGGDLGEPAINLVNSNLIKTVNVASSHAYVIHRRSYDYLLDHNNLTHFDVWMHGLPNQYMCYPLSVIQRHINKTDIGETNHTMSLDFWKKAYNKPINKLF
jgi:GR25 family glycosyltransferase involved in LPS biosynthesis